MYNVALMQKLEPLQDVECDFPDEVLLESLVLCYFFLDQAGQVTPIGELHNY